MIQSRLILVAILSFTVINAAYSQTFIEKLTNIFEFELGDPPDDTLHYHTKIVIAPVMAYEPSTSLSLGIGTKLLFKFKNAPYETRTSNLPAAITYTLKNQFIFSSEYTFFTNGEDYLIKGALNFLKYPYFFYGVGNLTTEESKRETDLKNFLFEPLVLKQVYRKLFLGGGFRYNAFWDAELGDEQPEGFDREVGASLIDSLNTRSVGFEFAATIDSRDNVLNALNGNFIELTHGMYSETIGSSNTFSITKLNLRKYFRITENRLDVIAFELFSRFTDGDVPIAELSALGGRELLRGFPESRFNDRHTIFFQTEYRWQAFERIGFVGFTGVGDVFNRFDKKVRSDKLKYSLGAGIRLKIVKSENLNIRLDYGFGLGPERDNNFYLGIAEAF